jgi:3-methyladenine DNA glycosylase/8-oxoguanine DNA glycosylase
MTFGKAEYIKNISEKIKNGGLNIDEIKNKNNEEVIIELSKLNRSMDC